MRKYFEKKRNFRDRVTFVINFFNSDTIFYLQIFLHNLNTSSLKYTVPKSTITYTSHIY